MSLSDVSVLLEGYNNAIFIYIFACFFLFFCLLLGGGEGSIVFV